MVKEAFHLDLIAARTGPDEIRVPVTEWPFAGGRVVISSHAVPVKWSILTPESSPVTKLAVYGILWLFRLQIWKVARVIKNSKESLSCRPGKESKSLQIKIIEGR